MGLLSIFKRKKKKPENVLQYVHQNRGLLWENISVFKDTILQHGGSVRNHTPEMEELMPVEHNLQDGLYTREIFMPKGTLVVSYIHKQNHKRRSNVRVIKKCKKVKQWEKGQIQS